MRGPQNIEELGRLKPDFLGLIFYPGSKRYVGEQFDISTILKLPVSVKKVGVFVNEDFETLITTYKKYSLDLIQLHGDETPEFCERVKREGVKIIKVFSIGSAFNFDKLKSYEPFCDYFLFDTKGEEYGGNGITFNWDILNNYNSTLPFFLSGGIGLENVNQIKKIPNKNLYAIDVNSRFESSPGTKDLEKLNQLFTMIRE